jgi:Fur family ferric uptake transcriptional regulator
MNQNLQAILKSYHIPVTKNRIVILKTFLHADGALTHRYFFKKQGHGLDRTSVFRTLNLFTKKGIIYRIPGADHVNRYLLRQTTKVVYSNFLCTNCKKILLLKTMLPAKVRLPKGFKQETIQILISGECNTCKQ